MDNFVTTRGTVDASQLLVKVRLVNETGSTIGGLCFCFLGGPANASNPHLRTVTFGVDSGTEVTLISPDTANDYPRERGRRQPCEIGTGRLVEDMGGKYLVLENLLDTRVRKRRFHKRRRADCQLQHWWTRSHDVTFKGRSIVRVALV